MNLTLALIFGGAGVILILVASIGGGFTISALSVPQVGALARVLSFVMGGILVVFALGVYELDNSVPPTDGPVAQQEVDPRSDDQQASDPAPFRAPIVAPQGMDINLFADATTASSVLTTLPHGQRVTILCTIQGESVTSEITGHASSLWNGVSVGGSDTVGYVPDVYVDTLTYQPTMPNCMDISNSTSV